VPDDFELPQSLPFGEMTTAGDTNIGQIGDIFNVGDITGSYTAGGYFYPLNEELDFVVTFGWVDAEVSSGGLSADDDGLSLAGGVRHAVNDEIEVEAMLSHVNFDDGGSDTGVELRGRYFFNEAFAVTAQLDLGKDIETFRIGIRYQF
jgi:hypothetical protein